MVPTLCETGVKFFLANSLKKTRMIKDKYFNIFYNVIMSALFIAIVGGFLLYKYKGKSTPSEIEERNRNKHQYIISKLQKLSAINNKSSLITDLPHWKHDMPV
jgi:hypothetical protein